ncbi:hypothetical protein GCM10009557_22620 [Virgisporangium ochraceum]|uniref:Uncharacterized protein n=2 Tax=Virgisporangium ochraceum TaxID=65505 RepID=A0A8J3ZQG4_9ACTN|nr:hypothetical protein Voc01_032290 [Virgisporangium ochraceum]
MRRPSRGPPQPDGTLRQREADPRWRLGAALDTEVGEDLVQAGGVVAAEMAGPFLLYDDLGSAGHVGRGESAVGEGHQSCAGAA